MGIVSPTTTTTAGTTNNSTAATAADTQSAMIPGGASINFKRNISQTTAVKFLYARKFDVPRAVSLYEQHEQIRLKEGLYNIDPDVEPLRSELQTGKFTILVSIGSYFNFFISLICFTFHTVRS